MNNNTRLNDIKAISDFQDRLRILGHNYDEQMRYCWELITSLQSRSSTADANVSDNVLLAYILTEVATKYAAYSEDQATAEELFVESIRYAELSGHAPIILHTLYLAGIFLARIPDGNTNKGIPLLLRATLYVDGDWPANFISVLTAIVEISARDAKNYALTVFLYDWLCQIQISPMNELLGKYKFMVQQGHAEDVIAALNKNDSGTCYDIAVIAAARISLTQNQEACDAAKTGIRMAQDADDTRWSREFRMFLLTFDR